MCTLLLLTRLIVLGATFIIRKGLLHINSYLKMLLQITKTLLRDSTYYFNILPLSFPLSVFSNCEVVMPAGRRLFFMRGRPLSSSSDQPVNCNSFFLFRDISAYVLFIYVLIWPVLIDAGLLC